MPPVKRIDDQFAGDESHRCRQHDPRPSRRDSARPQVPQAGPSYPSQQDQEPAEGQPFVLTKDPHEQAVSVTPREVAEPTRADAERGSHSS